LAALFLNFKQNLMLSLCLSTGAAKLLAETSQGTLPREAVQV